MFFIYHPSIHYLYFLHIHHFISFIISFHSIHPPFLPSTIVFLIPRGM